MKTVFIIIPTYNEKDNLTSLLNKLDQAKKFLPSNTALNVLFVDDNSPDGTAQVIEQEKNKRTFGIHILQRFKKQGLGTAYIAGFKYALALGADYIVQMDADLSHDPSVIPEMLNKLKDFDFVIGSRYIPEASIPNWSFFRKLISVGGNLYTRILLGFDIHDYTGGLNAYRGEVLKNIDLNSIESNGYSFQIEIKYRVKQKGYKYTEIPIQFYDRASGKSKFSRKIFIEAFLNTLRLRLS